MPCLGADEPLAVICSLSAWRLDVEYAERSKRLWSPKACRRQRRLAFFFYGLLHLWQTMLWHLANFSLSAGGWISRGDVTTTRGGGTRARRGNQRNRTNVWRAPNRKSRNKSSGRGRVGEIERMKRTRGENPLLKTEKIQHEQCLFSLVCEEKPVLFITNLHCLCVRGQGPI